MEIGDIKYFALIIPIFYVLIPYFITGNFIILGGVSVLAFVTGAIIFVILANINFGGKAEAVASGGAFHIGLNPEGGYSLFVIFVGGLFYLGAQIATFITPIFQLFVLIINAILGAVSFVFGINTSGLSTNLVSGMGSVFNMDLSQVYPLNIMVAGVSFFGTLDILMGCLFILGLYFMISARGK